MRVGCGFQGLTAKVHGIRDVVTTNILSVVKTPAIWPSEDFL